MGDSIHALVFIPSKIDPVEAIKRTTHMAIGAHQDDLEIMSYHGISTCYREPEKSYFGLVVTDGSGSARSGKFAELTDQEMTSIRRLEQEQAAVIGEYGALVQLGVSSESVKDPNNDVLIDELAKWIRLAKPEILYTHNPADKHPTHVGLTHKVILAVSRLEPTDRPKRVYGCEVWGDLDWLPDSKKIGLDSGKHPELAKQLLRVFDSQIGGGKRYDEATVGRRLANATYLDSHAVDQSSALTYAMDLTPLCKEDSPSMADYVRELIAQFETETIRRIRRIESL